MYIPFGTYYTHTTRHQLPRMMMQPSMMTSRHKTYISEYAKSIFSRLLYVHLLIPIPYFYAVCYLPSTFAADLTTFLPLQKELFDFLLISWVIEILLLG